MDPNQPVLSTKESPCHELFRQWEARTFGDGHEPHSPKNSPEWIALTITDGHSYQRVVHKLETDKLWPEVDKYAKKHHLACSSLEAFALSARGSFIDPYADLGDTHVLNGDTIRISQTTAHIFPGSSHEDPTRHPLLRLSPRDVNGELYQDPLGPPTRTNESILRLNFEQFWANVPPVHVKCRVLAETSIMDLYLVIADLTGRTVDKLRITHDGERAEGMVDDYCQNGYIELDVFTELLGGAPPTTYPRELLGVAPQNDLTDLVKIIVNHECFSATFWSPGSIELHGILRFLERHCELWLRFSFMGNQVDEQETLLSMLQRQGSKSPLLIDAVTDRPQPRFDETRAARGDIFGMVIEATIDPQEDVQTFVVPAGATLSQWLTVEKLSPIYVAKVQYSGVVIKGNPTFGQLSLDTQHRLRVVTDFAPQPPAAQNVPVRAYSDADYYGDVQSSPPGYTTLRFGINGVPFACSTIPTMPFFALLSNLYRAFGISLILSDAKGVINERESPAARRMHGVINLNAKLHYQPVNLQLPERVVLRATTFVNVLEDPRPVGVLAPASASVEHVWRKEARHVLINDPRFVIDGDRVPNDTRFDNLDLEDDSFIEVFSEQVGGGKPEGGVTDKRQWDEATQEYREKQQYSDNSSAEGNVQSTDNSGPTSTGSASHPTFMLENPISASDKGKTSFPFHPPPPVPPHMAPGFGTTFVPPQQQTGAFGQPAAPLGPNFGFPQAMAAPYYREAAVKLPQPAPFCGKGVETFFNKYEAYCDSYNMDLKKRFDGLYFFLSDKEPHDVLSYATKLAEWAARSYEGVKRELLAAFHEPEQDKYTVADLEHFVKQPRSLMSMVDINQYIIAFKGYGNTMLRHGLHESTYKDLFLKGLGPDIRARMRQRDVERGRLRKDITISELEADARSVFEAKTFYELFEQKEAREEDRRRNPSHLREPELQLRPTAANQDKDGELKELTNALKDLTIHLVKSVAQSNNSYQNKTIQVQPWMASSNRSIIGNPPPPPPSSRTPPPPARTPPPIRTPYRGDPTGRTTAHVSFPPNLQGQGQQYEQRHCHYCDSSTHGRFTCPEYKSHLQQGVFHEVEGKMVDPQGRLLPWRPGQMREVALTRYNEIQGRKTPIDGEPIGQTNHHEMVFDFFDEEQTRNNSDSWPAACNHSNVTGEHFGEVNEQRQRSAEDDAEGGQTGRNLRRRTTTPARTTEAAGPRGEHSGGQAQEVDQLMETVDQIVKDGKKRRLPTHHILSPAQEEISIPHLAQEVLEQCRIDLPFGRLCGLNPDLAKELCRQIKPRRVPIIGPTYEKDSFTASFSHNAEHGAGPIKPFYTHGLPVIKAMIGDTPVRCLIDGGSELDMISLETVQKIAGAYRTDGDHRVHGIGKQSVKMLGVMEDAEINIGGVKKNVHLWVQSGLGYDVFLGMPSIARFQLRQVMAKDGRLWIKLRDDNGVKVKILGVQADHPKNRTHLPPNLRPPKRTKVEDASSDSDSDDSD